MLKRVVREFMNSMTGQYTKKSLFFSSREVHETIYSLPSKSSLELDKISNFAPKRGGKKFTYYLCQIFNACTILEYFPNP